jgi:hypothetical protein
MRTQPAALEYESGSLLDLHHRDHRLPVHVIVRSSVIVDLDPYQL